MAENVPQVANSSLYIIDCHGCAFVLHMKTGNEEDAHMNGGGKSLFPRKPNTKEE